MKSKGVLHSLILMVFLTSLSCRDSGINPGQKLQRTELTAAQKQTIISSNQFGFSILKAVNNANETKNVVISPLSISMALGMTLNGANRSTYDSMRHVLGFEGLTNTEINQSYQGLTTLLNGLDSTVAFSIANSIWYRQDFPVRSDFVSVDKEYFNAEVSPLDFNDPGAAATINYWVSQATHGKIPVIVDPPIPPEAVMYLINAIYFKGEWTFRFDSLKTAQEPFTVPSGGQAEVPMMKQETKYLYYQNDAFQMVDLPYGRGDYRMTVLLPAAGEDINAVAGSLNAANWSGWINSLDSANVMLSLPRFTLECDFQLNEALRSMGMGIAFTDAADFTRISDSGGLYISKVKHKSFIRVGEEGTEAAAVTSVEISVTALPPSHGSVIMKVNRPFIFVIRDAPSGTLLFIGKVINPL